MRLTDAEMVALLRRLTRELRAYGPEQTSAEAMELVADRLAELLRQQRADAEYIAHLESKVARHN